MSQHCVHSRLPIISGRWQGTLLAALFTMVVVGCYAGGSAWCENRHRTLPMDLDGWGILVQRLKSPGASLGTLFSNPSLWKGPVVPFLFGLCYYMVPYDQSVLVFNVFTLAVAAGCFIIGFASFGIDRFSAVLAVLLGLCYWPHHYVFGYYYAEPFVTFLLSLLLLLVGWTISTNSRTGPFVTGSVGGVLLLARPPFLLPVCGIAIVLWYYASWRAKRARNLLWFVFGLVIVFTPWPLRNFLVYREFIPFTTEGGKIFFQGTYLPGDSVTMNEIRKIPEFAALEKGEGKDPIKQYRYWRALAVQQIRENPLKQLGLCFRKAIRFWVYLPLHSLLPTWNSTLVAAISLPFALVGAVLGRKRVLSQLCTIWITGLWTFHALVHAELRYNYPILPLFFLLAISGLRELWSRFFRVESGPRAVSSLEHSPALT